jgi:UDP-GlcNAc:undecaprenyl-phosphate GlcNAc-1-phosphate transferase
MVALLMMAIAGACLGFLKFNFNPARIFMGDTGSLFLGLMFSSLSIIGALKVTTTAAILVPLLIMGLPVLDTSFAIIRRFLNGKPIFAPDKEHVHHQLLALGLSQKQAVLYIYLICGTLGVIGLSLVFLIR